MKTILVAVDFSDSTGDIIGTVKTLATATGSRVLLLHVRQDDPLTGAQVPMSPSSFVPTPPTIVHAEAPAKTQQHLDELQRRFAGVPFEVNSLQSEGLPEAMILYVAKQESADMIVMGSHGHGAVYNLLMGSVTAGVLKHAECPVLVVPSRRAG